MTLGPIKTAPRATATLRGKVVKQLLKMIFTGDIPGGSRLVEEELADKLGVSRTPVREALGELAGIGFIQLKPNHGAIVRVLGPKELNEIYHIRRILESEATRLAHARLSPAALESLRDRHQALLNDASHGSPRWSQKVIAIDQQLHELLSQGSGNQRLADEIDRYRTLVESLREAIGNRLQALDRALREHIEIIDRLLSDPDPQSAVNAMAHHIDRGAETAVAALSQTRGVGAGMEIATPISDSPISVQIAPLAARSGEAVS